MIGQLVVRLTAALALLLALPSAAHAQGDWAGIWMSGTVRTVIAQDGQRVYGAFERIGEFDGLVSTDGNTLRAVVTSAQTGNRGYIELRKASPDVVIGTISERQFPSIDTPVWQGRLHISERTETDPGPLSFYAGNNQSYSSPVQYANAPDPVIDAWLRFDGPGLPELRPGNDPSTWTPERAPPNVTPFDTGQSDPSRPQPGPGPSPFPMPTSAPHPIGPGGGDGSPLSPELDDSTLVVPEQDGDGLDLPAADMSGGLWQGVWRGGDRYWELLQIDGRVIGSSSIGGLMTVLEGKLSPSGRSLRAVLNGADGVSYLEVFLNGDNVSFDGALSRITGGEGTGISALRMESHRPDIPVEMSYFPEIWNGRPPADVAAWLDGGDGSAMSSASTSMLAGRWSGDFAGTQFGPFGPAARIELAPPQADGMAIGEITRSGQNNALLYGRMLSDAEFRGVFILMDAQGRNPTGQWGTIRLLGSAAGGRLEGWWAYSYRIPLGGTRTRTGVPGGSLSAQSTNTSAGAAIISRDRLGVERAFAALEQFSGPMPLFHPELPNGEVLFALQRWWRGEGELCAAGCAPPQPTRLAIDALRVVHQPPHVLLPRTQAFPITYAIDLVASVGYRLPGEGASRAPETPAALVAPRANFLENLRAQNYLVSGRPEATPNPPVGFCDALETTTRLGQERRTLIVALPDALLLSADSEITVAIEAAIERSDPYLIGRLGPRAASFNVLARAFEVAAHRAANGLGPRPARQLGCDRGFVWIETGNREHAAEISVRWEFLP